MVSPYRSAPSPVLQRGPYHPGQLSRPAAATLPAQSLRTWRVLACLSAAVLVIALRAFMVWILPF